VYGTCLFCNHDLGRNQALEHFPVGRRLAYDETRGRLWVICRRCERWNLTPLEARWEAIEEAERAFRATRLRIATENIGLARLKEGAELVRIGTAPRLELAGWRYGDQFGRRRRKFYALAGVGLVMAAAPAFIGFAGVGVAAIGSTGLAALNFKGSWKAWKQSKVPTVYLTDDDGRILPLTVHDTWSAKLVPLREPGEWHLTFQYREAVVSDSWKRFAAFKRSRAQAVQPAVLHGLAAQRALAALMPYANETGGSQRRIREAVDVIESKSSLNQLVYAASTNTIPQYGNYLTRLPAPMRLALEMVLHEDDERRALEGELAKLEERWREAEEIASIADSLLTPAGTEARLEALRRTRD
jgi:hypothetical protein